MSRDRGTGRQVFEPGTLWELVRRRSASALEAGALLPIETEARLVEDQGVRFVVRVVEGLGRKDRAGALAVAPPGGDGRPNPFLPFEEELYVAEVAPSHRCLLNKFNVLAGHALIVTRRFEEQEELLGPGDFGALARCLAEGEALGFYNGGEAAGASQRHKHLQVVPLPLLAEAPRPPLEPLLLEAPEAGGPTLAPRLPFDHRVARLGPGLGVEARAAELHGLYLAMARQLGVAGEATGPGERQRRPYNLLVTREWMALVPRSTERCEGISVNAVGFAGGLLVRSRAELDAVVRLGPMTLLGAVGVPRHPSTGG